MPSFATESCSNKLHSFTTNRVRVSIRIANIKSIDWVTICTLQDFIQTCVVILAFLPASSDEEDSNDTNLGQEGSCEEEQNAADMASWEDQFQDISSEVAGLEDLLVDAKSRLQTHLAARS